MTVEIPAWLAEYWWVVLSGVAVYLAGIPIARSASRSLWADDLGHNITAAIVWLLSPAIVPLVAVWMMIELLGWIIRVGEPE